MADGKLLKILSKIAGKLTYLKDVITITEPCAPTRRRPARQRQPPHLLPASLPRLRPSCASGCSSEAATRIARSRH